MYEKNKMSKDVSLRIPLCSGHMQPDREYAEDRAPFLRAGKEILVFSIVSLRACLHKKYVWIFEHNFVADKAKIRRWAVGRNPS